MFWRHHIEPRLITTGIGSMHLVDQATLESFLAVLIDEAQNYEQSQPKLFEYESTESSKEDLGEMPLRSGDLQRTGNMLSKTIVQNFNWIQGDDAVFVKDLVILEDDFKLSIVKKNDTFSILVERAQLNRGLEDSQNEQDAVQAADAAQDEHNQLLLRIKPLQES